MTDIEVHDAIRSLEERLAEMRADFREIWNLASTMRQENRGEPLPLGAIMQVCARNSDVPSEREWRESRDG